MIPNEEKSDNQNQRLKEIGSVIQGKSGVKKVGLVGHGNEQPLISGELQGVKNPLSSGNLKRDSVQSSFDLKAGDEQVSSYEGHASVNLKEFQRLVKVQISTFQLGSVEEIQRRFVKPTPSFDINPNYSIYQDVQTNSLVAVKHIALGNFVQHQIDAHHHLNNIFQMHLKNFSPILSLKHFFIDSNHFYYISKAPRTTIKQLLKSHNGFIKESTCLQWFIEITEGLLALESVMESPDLCLDLSNICIGENEEILFADIGTAENTVQKLIEASLKEYRSRTIDISTKLFEFKKQDFRFDLYSIGVIFLAILSLETAPKYVEIQYFLNKIEDLLFIPYLHPSADRMSKSSSSPLGTGSSKVGDIILSSPNNYANSIRAQYSPQLIQLVQDCIFHQQIMQFKDSQFNLAAVLSSLNYIASQQVQLNKESSLHA